MKYETKKLWKDYTLGYDKVLTNLSFYQDLTKKHIEALEGTRKVLDIGAGTGNVTIPLIAQGTKVYAVDMSAFKLSKLMEKVDDLEQSTDRIWVGLQDGNEMNLQNNYFDGASCMNVLYLPSIKPEKFLTEVYRVLEKDGIFALSSFKHNPDFRTLLVKGMEELQERGLVEKLQKEIAVVREVNEKQLFTDLMENTYSKDEIAALLKQVGFKVEGVEDVYLDQSFFVVARK